jgi:hypothetical protein
MEPCKLALKLLLCNPRSDLVLRAFELDGIEHYLAEPRALFRDVYRRLGDVDMDAMFRQRIVHAFS